MQDIKSKKAYIITINHELCKQCGICAEYCPQKVLGFTQGAYPEVINQDACTGCMLCFFRCPDFAIEVERINAS